MTNPSRFPVRALLLLMLLAFAQGAAPARAEEVVRDAVLGARLLDALAPGDVHAYLVDVAARTDVRVELRTADDGAAKDGGSDPVPLVVLLGPGGAELGRASADAGDIRRTVTTAGTHRIEVRAGQYAGGYELRLEGRAASQPVETERRPVVLTGAPAVVHVDAPANSSVEVEVRRRSGGAPQVDSVADALGRPLQVFVRDVRRKRLRLEPIPVAIEGGLDLTLSASGDGTGTYELRTRVRAGTDALRGDDERETRRIVAVLAPGADPAAIATSLGFTLVEVRGSLAVFETPEGREGSEAEDADACDAIAGVLGAEADLLARMPEGSQSNAVLVGSHFGRTDLETQTALGQIRAPLAHDVATGAGVVVAVLDGGFDATHPFLEGRVLTGIDFLAGDADPTDETNGLDDDADGLVDEGFGHGTFVASLVLAAAPGASILPVRVLDTDGRGTVSDIATGITWAADNGADVINLSLGTLGGSTTLAAAVRYAVAKGAVVVAAAGNDGNATIVDFPASMTEVIAVSALDATGGRAPFSNAGAATTLAAPGSALIGAYPADRYAEWSGTSFSTAFVAGGAALVIERVPEIAPIRVRMRLLRGTRPIRRTLPRARRRGLGAGALDLARLVR